jgi:hypothetical protein
MIGTGTNSPRTENVKVKTLDQVRFGFIEDLDLHRSFSRMLALAVSQSSNLAVPSATRCRRLSRISLCQSANPGTQSFLEIATGPPKELAWQQAFLELSFRVEEVLFDMIEIYPGRHNRRYFDTKS